MDPGVKYIVFEFITLPNNPLLDTNGYPELGGNINGPSLIRVPDWVVNPLGRYYLYFAHHEGTSIRLAYADELTGPWALYTLGTLHLRDSKFHQTAPLRDETHPDVLSMIMDGVDGDYPHIASPDVHIENTNQQILMYYHGRLKDGTQQTRLAISGDGIHFSVEDELLGQSYFRVFQHQEYYYAIALGAVLYRSPNGRTGFERGPTLIDQNYRHGAVMCLDNETYVIWTRAGDCPERLLISQLDTTGPWHAWSLANTSDLHRPQADWEGADEALAASNYGGLMSRGHQLRDPCVFQEDGKNFILYSIAGEQGLAIGELQ